MGPIFKSLVLLDLRRWDSIGCPETSVITSQKCEDRIDTAADDWSDAKDLPFGETLHRDAAGSCIERMQPCQKSLVQDHKVRERSVGSRHSLYALMLNSVCLPLS